jgi:hypothetical protein
MSNSSNIISLNITKFPQNILIPDMDNDVSIQATNNSNKNENFRFVFEGENLDVHYKSELLNDQVEFAANETKSIDLKLNPTASGSGKLIINGFWLKIVEYTVKVQKVRETVPKNKLNKILENYKFKGTEKIDSIDPKEYLLGMTLKEIQTAEEQLKTMKKNYDSSLSSNSTNSEAFSRVTIEVIDKTIKQLAKGYLSNNNIQNALGIALELSDPNDRINFYINLIRAYAFENMNDAVQIIRSLNDINLQQNLLKSLIFDQASHNPIPALTLTTGITDSSTKILLLFNIAKQLNDDNNSSELPKIFRKTIETVLKSIGLNSEDKKDQKFFYESLKDAINGIAEIENPGAANNIIEGIDNQTLKESITKDLFDMIYELVDEIRTKIESELVFSQFFLLNTYISNINNEIKSFSNIGGNVSSNILSGDFNFNIVFLSLFKLDFSIFPFIDRVYSDLKFNLKKSFGYYIFPSAENFKNNEVNILQKSLQQFFNNFTSVSNQLFVFNLDFIPYLGKPTVILSSESPRSNVIKSKIEKLGDNVNLIIDDSLFKGGEIYDNLTKIIPSTKGEIFNLILSYEFINDYNAFKAFIQSLF